MNFEEWKQWKESQPNFTCSHVGCQQVARWCCVKNKVYFCVEHAAEIGGYAGIERLYSEFPIYLVI